MGAAQAAPLPGGLSREQRLEEAYRLSRGGRGAASARPRLSLRLRAARAGAFEGTLVQLPASVMPKLVEDNPQGEHVYRIRSAHGSYCFAGVRGYAAPAGRALLAAGLWRALGVAEGDPVELDLVNCTARHRSPLVPLPVATQLHLRWESAERYDGARELEGGRAVELQEALERAVDESYPVLMVNDVVRFEFQGAPCELRVLGLRVRVPPAGAAAEGAEGGEDSDEELSRAVRESLAAHPPKEAGEAEDAALGPGEVARLRVPPWEAFERRLVVEPPLGWVAPAPFPDAVWDPERRRYHPAGWRWDDGLETYIAPARAEHSGSGGGAAATEAARGAAGAASAAAEATRGPAPPPSAGAGRALGGASGDLPQEELRRRRAEALERLCQPSAPLRTAGGGEGAAAPVGAAAAGEERSGAPAAGPGAGKALGGACAPGGEGGNLSQEELRQKRAEAMERRLLRHLSNK